MAGTMRWRYGETNPVMMPVEAGTAIEIGDLLLFDTDHVAPAALLSDQGSEASNQEMFHDMFAGVAMQASGVGDSQPIRVATTGVFEFDCLSATVEVGDLLAPDEDAGGTALLSQTVAKVAAPDAAIGRCAKRVNPAGTRVLVDIVSSLLRGGPQAIL